MAVSHLSLQGVPRKKFNDKKGTIFFCSFLKNNKMVITLKNLFPNSQKKQLMIMIKLIQQSLHIQNLNMKYQTFL